MNAARRKRLYSRVLLITAISTLTSIAATSAVASLFAVGPSPVAVAMALACSILIVAPVSYLMLKQSARLNAAHLELDRAHRSLVETRQILEHRTRHDQMTGLTNRETFIAAICQGRRETDSGFLMIIDVDHFKTINDTYGQMIGDKALVAIAGEVSGNIREGDLAARLGGEEFAVFLPGASLAEAIQVSERIRQAIEHLDLMLPDGEIIPLTVSLGGAEKIYSHPLDAVMNKADDMLDEAKSTGRNRAVVVPELARAA